MSRIPKHKRRKEAVGAAGVASLLLASVASAGASAPAADMAARGSTPPLEINLSEEEVADVTLRTFHVFDRENAHPGPALERIARCYRCTTRATCRCRYKGSKG